MNPVKTNVVNVLDVAQAAVAEKTADADNKRKRGFEGGQNPLNRRLPKFGFTSPNKVYAQLINLQNLEDNADVETGSSLDKTKLKALGLIKKEDKPVKLLGKGKLSKKLNIEVDMTSASAAEAVKKAGGEVVTIG